MRDWLLALAIFVGPSALVGVILPMLTLYIALMGTVATLLILWVELATAYKSRTVPVRHTQDCDAWSPKGLTDPHRHAPHTTDHFAQIREQVNLTGQLDGQIGTER